MIKKYLLRIAIAFVGFFIADYFLKGVDILNLKYTLIIGVTLGTINFFIRPLINIATFPLRVLTLGLFSFFVNIAIIWFVKAMFQEIEIEGFLTLVYTTLIILTLEFTASATTK